GEDEDKVEQLRRRVCPSLLYVIVVPPWSAKQYTNESVIDVCQTCVSFCRGYSQSHVSVLRSYCFENSTTLVRSTMTESTNKSIGTHRHNRRTLQEEKTVVVVV